MICKFCDYVKYFQLYSGELLLGKKVAQSKGGGWSGTMNSDIVYILKYKFPDIQ